VVRVANRSRCPTLRSRTQAVPRLLKLNPAITIHAPFTASSLLGLFQPQTAPKRVVAAREACIVRLIFSLNLVAVFAAPVRKTSFATTTHAPSMPRWKTGLPVPTVVLLVAKAPSSSAVRDPAVRSLAGRRAPFKKHGLAKFSLAPSIAS